MVQRYFDNGATSFPKPPEVAEAVARYLNEVGGNYGRSAHGRTFEVSRVVERCRDRLAERLGIAQVDNLCFAANATEGANVILGGFRWPANARVLISPLEHNALARPLERARAQGLIQLEILPAGPDGRVDVSRIPELLDDSVALVVVNHQSNVNGVIQPLAEIKQAIGAIPLLVDASQSAGKLAIDVDGWGIDFLVFTGHKGLLGPTGTGGFYLGRPELVEPLLYGGTGSNSEQLAMPTEMPVRFEAGTPNIAGLFGLEAALAHPPVAAHSRADFLELLAAVQALPGYQVHGAQSPEWQGEVLSITHQQMDVGELAWRLADEFGIETRAGLHCAPLAHRHIGTFPDGTCRLTPSPYQSPADFAYLLDALRQLHEHSLRSAQDA